jgi:predicted nucleic acid-binding protein
MPAIVFVDTNVLIYALDRFDLKKHQAAQAWRGSLWKGRNGRLSFQVLQEFYSKITQKWPAAREEARAEVIDLLAWKPIATDEVILNLGWRMQDRYQLSFWDSLIAAAAKVSACRYLLTEDLQAGQTLDGVTVVNPFVSDPSSLSSDE